MSFSKPLPITLTDRLMKIQAKRDALLKGFSPVSVRAIVSRIATKHNRKFKTRAETGGVRVWRLK